MEDKFIFGKLLGEMYRIQKRIDQEMCPVSDSTIHGLIEGIEYVVDAELKTSPITKNETDAVTDVLNGYFDGGVKEETFEGYYTIEDELEERGIDRSTARPILKQFLAERRFVSLIEKMDSGSSPIECRDFSLDECDK